MPQEKALTETAARRAERRNLPGVRKKPKTKGKRNTSRGVEYGSILLMAFASAGLLITLLRGSPQNQTVVVDVCKQVMTVAVTAHFCRRRSGHEK